MLPFIAAGLAMLAASTVAWYYNEKTEEEKEKQQAAYKERDHIRQQFKSSTVTENKRFIEEQRDQAASYRRLLLETIDDHSKKINPIATSLKEIFSIINSEIQADTTSPYRKSALRREFPQIQDAQMRLEEYEKYLSYEKNKINELWEKGNYGWLLDREVPDALLPFEWLYLGKLVIVNLSEIGERQSPFRHRILFSGFDGQQEQQKALALSYGDEFPLLITKQAKKGDGTFFGCVARGICFHDHIRQNLPIVMTIDNYISNKKTYFGNIYDGLLKVALPEKNLQHQSLRLFTGQKTEVYFDGYDACLSIDPAKNAEDKPYQNKKSPPLVTVSERIPAIIGTDSLELYIEINAEHLQKIPEDNSFYSDKSAWMLTFYDYENNEVTLSKGYTELVCCLAPNRDGLTVMRVSLFDTPKVGIDIPFGFVLVTEDINPSEIFGWTYGVEQFFSFVSQAMIDSSSLQERIQQVEFFKRWQSVINYQKAQESEDSIEFACIPTFISDNVYELIISSKNFPKDDNKKTVISLIKEAEKKVYLQLSRVCKLMIWDATQSRYIPAIKRSEINQSIYQVEADGVHIEAALLDYRERFRFEESQRFKMIVSLPNIPLQRQQQALDAFFEDRMIEPRLKDIFLSPKSYRTEYLPYWNDCKIAWSSELTNSQMKAVEKALSSKYLTVIQGPPGTGKTTTIVEILYQLLSHNPHQKILVVSQQNTAVDNALNKFKNKCPDLIGRSVNIVRIGNPEKLDDDIVENHLDKIYTDFLDDKISYATKNSNHLSGDIQNASYQWITFLKTMKARSTENKVSDEFFTTMLADKNLIGATCVGLSARKGGIDHLVFDVAIIDEAGRATVPELLIPLLRSKKAILIGDHHQLPPSIAPVLREDAAKETLGFLEETFLESSFFEMLFEELPEECTATLSEQFRMAAPIGDLVAELFYTKNGERRLSNGNENTDTSRFLLPNCLIWFDIIGQQVSDKGSTSIKNEKEAIAIVEFLHKNASNLTREIDVAVITPYGAQKRLIRKLLSKYSNGSQQFKLGSLTIKVDTVDSFQGSEAELVCYSTVRTTGSLQFLLDKKRLNVACSRAKENLIFFGDKNYLETWRPNNEQQNLFYEIIRRSRTISSRSTHSHSILV